MTDILAALLQALLPHILEILGAFLTVVIGWAANTVRQRWGIQIEQAHREALHGALMTGARAALSRGLNTQQAIDQATAYAKHSVPEAIRRLRPSEVVLAELARAKIAQIKQ